MARLQICGGIELARRDVLREVLHGRDVLRDEILDGGCSLARGIIEFLPGTAAVRDQIRDQEAGDDAVRYALSGIAGRHIDVFLTGVAANETAVVDRVHDLAGPSVRLPTQFGDKATDP